MPWLIRFEGMMLPGKGSRMNARAAGIGPGRKRVVDLPRIVAEVAAQIGFGRHAVQVLPSALRYLNPCQPRIEEGLVLDDRARRRPRRTGFAGKVSW